MASGQRSVVRAPDPQSLIPSGSPVPSSPSPASLFSVRTPTAIVTDLGTEFGVDVDKAGQTETHVFVGEVVAAVAGPSGQMARSIHLKAGETTTIAKNAPNLTAVRTVPGDMKKYVRTMPGAPVVLFQEDASGPTRLFGWGNGEWPMNSWKTGRRKKLPCPGHHVFLRSFFAGVNRHEPPVLEHFAGYVGRPRFRF